MSLCLHKLKYRMKKLVFFELILFLCGLKKNERFSVPVIILKN